MRNFFVLLLFIGSCHVLLSQSFPPFKGPLATSNLYFHQQYNRWVAVKTASFGTPGHPVFILAADSLVLLWNGTRKVANVVPPAYHELKAVDHLVLGLFSLLAALPEGTLSAQGKEDLKSYSGLIDQIGENLKNTHIRPDFIPLQQKILKETKQCVDNTLADLRNDPKRRDAYAKATVGWLLQNVEESARLEVELLHKYVSNWRALMDSASFAQCYAVVGSSHQARYRQLALQYFGKVFHEQTGATALTENHVVAAEGVSDEKKCLSLLARHLIDQQIGVSFFDDPYRMQRDLLSDGAAKVIDPLFK